MQQRPFWFLLNIYGWVVFAMSIVTAILVNQAWIVLLGVIGYQFALLVDLIWGRSLGKTGAIRLARTEQENRELKAEQARLLGAIRERDEKLAQQRVDSSTVISDAGPPVERGDSKQIDQQDSISEKS